MWVPCPLWQNKYFINVFISPDSPHATHPPSLLLLLTTSHTNAHIFHSLLVQANNSISKIVKIKLRELSFLTWGWQNYLEETRLETVCHWSSTVENKEHPCEDVVYCEWHLYFYSLLLYIGYIYIYSYIVFYLNYLSHRLRFTFTRHLS